MAKQQLRCSAAKLCLAGLLALGSGAADAAEAAEAGAAEAGEASQAAEDLRPVLLDTQVNGQPIAEPQLFLRDARGATYAPETALRQWRIRVPARGKVSFEGEPYLRIDSLAALRTAISEADQSIVIEADASLFERQTASLSVADDLDMTPSGTGGFINYDGFLEYSRGAAGFSGAFELVGFTAGGVGSTTFVSHLGAGADKVTRLETNWTIDRPSRMSSIRIGDSISRGGPGSAPIRFGGIQYARNFSVQPGFLTMPLPSLEGSAAVASVVDVYVNNNLQGSRSVEPGPFSIGQVPVQSGGGSVQLVMRDILGREVVTSQNYYASRELLRRHLDDFSYEAGFVRRDFGRRSNGYGTLMAAVSHRYGVSDHLTAEGHVEASADTQMASAGAMALIGTFGIVSGSAAFSHGDGGSGAQFAGALERRNGGYSLGVRAQYSTAAFSFIGAPDDQAAPKLSGEAFFDLRLFGSASFGLNYILRDNRGRDDERLLGAFANVGLGRLGSVQIFARRTSAGQTNNVVGATFSLLFKGKASSSATVQLDGGRPISHYSYQTAVPAGIGSSWRTNASMGGGAKTLSGAYSLQSSAASMNLEVARVGSRTGVRASASGAIGLVGGNFFASRRLGSSFAAVQVPGYKGVRVYADNQLVGVTGRKGTVIVPTMRAFERNEIRIEEADLPMDVQLARFETAVKPFARSGTLISFPARRERGVLIRAALADGSPLPPGAMARIEGREGELIVASGGILFVPDFGDRAQVRVSWDGGACAFIATLAESDDPQPVLEGLVCRPVENFASN